MPTTERLLELTDRELLGTRLRELRVDAGLSLRELAEQLGISVSAVSQIERGVLQPSVNRLLAIVTALGVHLADVFDDGATTAPDSTPEVHGYVLARAGGIRTVRLEGGVLYRRLSPTHSDDVDFFESTYPPRSTAATENELIQHIGYEVGTITAGELTIRFEDDTVTLRAGDSITFPCAIPHRIENIGDAPAVATWLIVHTQPRR